MSTALDHVIATALHYLGTPYKWGGDDPSGFDCSGFVLELLKTAGFVGETDDLTADGLLRKYAHKQVAVPIAGALLFYLDTQGKAYHVVFCLDGDFLIGANSGTSKTLDPVPKFTLATAFDYLIALVKSVTNSAAWRDNAYIKIRPIKFNPATMKVVYLFG